jgi:predicted O-methyltransferase YrrM
MLANIFRILGNDNPPRDRPGKRELIIRQICEEEPNFEDTGKWFILNRMHQTAYRRQICETLDQYNAHYITVPFDRDCPGTAQAVALRGINLNAARNLAINVGHTLGNYTVVLDGDCQFEAAGWAPVAEAMRQGDSAYLSIPHRRVGTDYQGEPMLAFRADSQMTFNESLPFGQGDKLDLLFRLGHDRTPLSGHLRIDGNLTRLVGEVLHNPTGKVDLEMALPERERNRRMALDWFADRVTRWPVMRFEVQRPLGQFWQQLEGFFDYSGQYSSFAFDAPDNSHVVEVGSWLGKSTVYLATQFKAFGKRVRIDAVDTWDGGQDQQLQARVVALGGAEAVYQQFRKNVLDAHAFDITPVRSLSVEAASQYADESLDLVFLDADHTYESVLADLQAWYPKVKPGGLIAGHDFVFDHPVSKAGVVRAVLEFFADKPLEIMPAGRVWKSVKYGNEPQLSRRRRWC